MENTQQNTLEEMFDNIEMKANQIAKRPDNSDMQGVHWEITFNGSKPVYYTEGEGHFVNSHHKLRNKLVSQPYIESLLTGVRCPLFGNSGLTENDRKGLFTDRVKFDRKNYRLVPTPPKKEDVLFSLVIDAGALLEDFDDWCMNFGYGSDSMKARKMFDDCRNNGALLLSLGIDIHAAQEYFQDY